MTTDAATADRAANPARVPLAIFDFDGTLVDTWDWFADELVAAVAALRRRTVTRADVESLRRVGSREALKSLGIGRFFTLLIAHRIRKRAAAASGEFRTFAGLPEMLHDLRRAGLRLALVSSNAECVVANALGDEINGLFSAHRCSAAAFSKARAFRSILKETGFRASDAVVIGDETRDIEAAHDAGIDAIGVEWGFADKQLLRSVLPGRTVATPDELRSLVLCGRPERLPSDAP